MNLKKEIFERISSIEKVELSETKKIELALVDDLNDVVDEGKRILSLQEDGLKWYNKAVEFHKEFLKVLTDSIGVIQSSEKYIPKLPEQILTISGKISKQATELGLDAKQIKGYNEALKIAGQLSDNSGRSKDLLNELQKFK
jgi:hypothetical protein